MAAVPSFPSVFGDSELIGRGALSTCVCATLALPIAPSVRYGRIGVAQTLLSVLVRLGRSAKISRCWSYAFAAMFVTVAGFLSPITQLPWKIAPSSMISAGVSMSL